MSPLPHNLDESVKIAGSIRPQTLTTVAVEGTVIDVSGWEEAMVIFSFGTITSGSGHSQTGTVQEGDAASGSDMAAITDATTGALLYATGQNKAKAITLNLSERKRYLRAVITPGVNSGGPAEALFILSRGRNLPATQELTAVHIDD